jgi:hypothetical protein
MNSSPLTIPEKFDRITKNQLEIIMMKRLLPLLGLILYTSVSVAGYDDGYISEGEYEYGVWVDNYDELIVIGGGADRIYAEDYGYLEVRYTSTPISHSSGIRDIGLSDYSELLYLGGATNVISIHDRATATLKGGQINYIRSFQKVINDVPNIDLYCQTGWSWMYNTFGEIKGITGMWKNGSEFSIQFLDQSGYDPVWKNIHVIPEPATLALLGVGGLLLRRKK